MSRHVRLLVFLFGCLCVLPAVVHVALRMPPFGAHPLPYGDAINAAAAQHVFPGIDFSGTPAILHTAGNPDCHLVLRGGGGKPNYSAADVEGAR